MQRVSRAALLLILAACSGGTDSPVDPRSLGSDAFLGRYALEQVNGNNLPAAVLAETGTVEVVGSTLTLFGDGRFTLSDLLRLPAPGSPTPFKREYSGVYQTSDTDITLVIQRLAVTGMLNGNTLTVLRGAPSYRYRK
ncbi:MAG: hypothetical protein ABI681_12150 [Gemmatimonadales bacterium]